MSRSGANIGPPRPRVFSEGGRAAERGGFEPPVPLRVRLISNQVPSTARSSLRRALWLGGAWSVNGIVWVGSILVAKAGSQRGPTRRSSCECPTPFAPILNPLAWRTSHSGMRWRKSVASGRGRAYSRPCSESSWLHRQRAVNPARAGRQQRQRRAGVVGPSRFLSPGPGFSRPEMLTKVVPADSQGVLEPRARAPRRGSVRRGVWSGCLQLQATRELQ